MRLARWLLGPALLALAPITLARAGALAADEARVLSADPNVPVFGVAYRGAARATLGSPIRPVSGASGFQLALVPLLELHDRVGSSEAIPFENWRGRIEVHAGWRVERQRYVLTGWLGVEHESDHPTVWQPPYPTTSYFTLNSAVLRGELTVPLGAFHLSAAVIERLYVDACTSVAPRCNRAFGDGSRTFEQGFEAVADGWDGGGEAPRPFAALAVSALIGAGRAHSERRLVLRAGVRIRQREVGLWQAYGMALFGNDVGLYRNDTVTQLGGGAAFSF